MTAFSMMFLAALQIAGPMVAVLLLADVALALLSRAAPALNIFAFGFPVKILLTLTMLGLTFPLLPPALDALMEHAARAMISLRERRDRWPRTVPAVRRPRSRLPSA